LWYVTYSCFWLLTKFPEDQAVPMMIHLWYSVFLPKCMVDALQKTILPRIDQVYSKIKDKTSNFAQGETYKVGNKSTLRILLSKEDWLRLKEALTVPEGLTASMGRQVRQATTLNPARADALNFELFLRRPGGMAAWRTFCEDGVLLPFGSSRASFDTPNPQVPRSAYEQFDKLLAYGIIIGHFSRTRRVGRWQPSPIHLLAGLTEMSLNMHHSPRKTRMGACFSTSVIPFSSSIGVCVRSS
jgi:hypothetical protein